MVAELRQQVTDLGSSGKYFALMLHIDDDDLDPYEYRLLGHYRRVCGATNKPCFESTLTTAKITRMSDDKVRATRKRLESLGRIIVDEQSGSTTKVTVCDLMAENVERYSGYPYQKREGSGVDTPTKNGRGGLPKTGVKEESYKKKESNTSCDTASQVASDALQFPEAPKGFQWVSSSDSDQPHAHLTTGNITGPVLCKRALAHRNFYKPGQRVNPRQPCEECLKVASAPKPVPKPPITTPDALFSWIAEHITKQNPQAAWESAKQRQYVFTLLAAPVNAEKRLLQVETLSQEQRDKVAEKMPRFIQWYRKECEGCSLPKDVTKFENWINQWYQADKPAPVVQMERINHPDGTYTLRPKS